MRKDKIIYWSRIYASELRNNGLDEITAPILNKAVIDSVGLSGLTEVKKNAWKEN